MGALLFIGWAGAFYIIKSMKSTLPSEIQNQTIESSKNSPNPVASTASDKEQKSPQHPSFVSSYEVQKNSSVFSTLKEAGLSGKEILKIISAAKPIVDFRKIKPGNSFSLFWDSEQKNNLNQIIYSESPTRDILLKKSPKDQTWSAEAQVKETTVQLENYQGVINNTLWSSASEAKMHPSIITKLTDIYSWQIDFSREVRIGNKWRLTIEREYINSKPLKWKDILVSEYVKQDETLTAVKYTPKNGKSSYYAPDGNSLKKIFLKSPVSFSRITSRFNMRRFHPILKRIKPHRGVDYAAATGTPVKAVGDGVISQIGYSKSAGKYIKIKHSSIYSTSYQHLSRFAKGMHKGKKITQGKIIGHVGSTGLATGPHLHFAFFERGKYVDPLGIKFPSANPIPTKNLKKFTDFAIEAVNMLPKWKNISSLVTAKAEH